MAGKIATRAAYGEALVELAEQYPELVVFDADLSNATMTKGFAAKYPERFFDMGIAECNMTGVAAGMSMLTGVTEAIGLTKAGTTARLRKVLEQYGLPIDVDASAEELIPYISNDKKMRGNHITLVIIEEIGKARLLPLAAEDLPKYIRKKDAQ